MNYYLTLKKPIEFEGVGIHTGKFSKIRISPSKISNNKINFFINHNKKVESTINNVIDTNLCTTLGYNSHKILTVEHLLSALFCLFLTNLDIYIIEGEEIPGLDGSSKPFVEKILKSELKKTNLKIKLVEIKDKFTFKIKNSIYKVSPANRFEIICSIKTNKSKYLNGQKFKFILTPKNYTKQISSAKTYCLLEDINKILLSGKGSGGSLENVIVVNKDKVFNPEILTYKNECVRHKILDFLGDLSLLNSYFKAKFEIVNPSHYANYEFCKYLINRRIIHG